MNALLLEGLRRAEMLWHFQYKLDKQETFLDEMELIGYTEKQLREAGWNTEEMLDHKPG
jgi:hypothetical protein